MQIRAGEEAAPGAPAKESRLTAGDASEAGTVSYVSRRCRGTDSLSGGEIRGNNTGGEINEDVWGANAVPHPLPLLFLSLLYAALSLSPSLSFSVY